MTYKRTKEIKGNRYWYLVKGQRINGKVQQKVVKYLGRNPGELGTTPTARGGESIKRIGAPQPLPPGTRTFTPEATQNIEERPGVYRFYNNRGEIVYVGISADLGARLRRWHGIPTPNPEHSTFAVRPDVQEKTKYFNYFYTRDMDQAQKKELQQIQRHQPRYNRTSGGGWHENPGSGRAAA